MDSNEARANARAAAMQRTKPKVRKTLASQKEPDQGMRSITKGSTMLSITGREANGYQITPGTLTTFAFVVFLVIALMHMFN